MHFSEECFESALKTAPKFLLIFSGNSKWDLRGKPNSWSQNTHTAEQYGGYTNSAISFLAEK
jgi:hypothetical protein